MNCLLLKKNIFNTPLTLGQASSAQIAPLARPADGCPLCLGCPKSGHGAGDRSGEVGSVLPSAVPARSPGFRLGPGAGCGRNPSHDRYVGILHLLDGGRSFHTVGVSLCLGGRFGRGDLRCQHSPPCPVTGVIRMGEMHKDQTARVPQEAATCTPNIKPRQQIGVWSCPIPQVFLITKGSAVCASDKTDSVQFLHFLSGATSSAFQSL